MKEASGNPSFYVILCFIFIALKVLIFCPKIKPQLTPLAALQSLILPLLLMAMQTPTRYLNPWPLSQEAATATTKPTKNFAVFSFSCHSEKFSAFVFNVFFCKRRLRKLCFFQLKVQQQRQQRQQQQRQQQQRQRQRRWMKESTTSTPLLLATIWCFVLRSF